MKQSIHEAAAKGFQVAGEAYEKGRPEYPLEALQYLARELKLNDQTQIVDLAAGTGKFTRALYKFAKNIVAIEPVEGMRRKLIETLPSLITKEGTAESIPLPDHFADVIFVAQAFHWFDGAKALPEIHRVLKPGGTLVMIWNVRDESVDWVRKITEIMDPYEKGTPRYATGQWREAFQSTSLFTPVQNISFPYAHRSTPEMAVDRVSSTSFISALPDSKKTKVLSEVRAMLAQHPLTKGLESFDYPYKTQVYTVTAKAGPAS